jgi:hypothetical protein
VSTAPPPCSIVYMTQAPSPIRAMYRRTIKQLTYQAIVD